MTRRIAIHHRTHYRYDRPVLLSRHEVRLRPMPQARARVERYALTVAPRSWRVTWYWDAYGNRVAQVFFDEALHDLTLQVELIATLPPTDPFDFLVAEAALRFPFAYAAAERHALGPYLEREPGGPALRAWLEHLRSTVARDGVDTIDAVVNTSRAVAGEVHYTERLEPGTRDSEATLEQKSGSCRDSGWLLVQTLRHLDIAARFVSGYLVQLGHEAASGEDSIALHAWCEAYVPGAGWLGLDATSGLVTAEGHIPLAVGATPDVTAAVTGYAEPTGSKLSYDMRVERLGDADDSDEEATSELPAARVEEENR